MFIIIQIQKDDASCGNRTHAFCKTVGLKSTPLDRSGKDAYCMTWLFSQHTTLYDREFLYIYFI